MLYQDAGRLGLLTAIVGVDARRIRADDAPFSTGAIYWRSDRHEEAVRWWRDMRVNQTNRYPEGTNALLAALGTVRLAANRPAHDQGGP